MWTKVEDQLPPEGAQVIAWAADGKNQTKELMRECIHLQGRFTPPAIYNTEMRGVTHWMAFPEPPYQSE